MTTGSVGTGVCGNDPSRLTNAFARLPSSAAMTVSCTTRLPVFACAHFGSMPMRMMGLPGSLPSSLTWPLIEPRPPDWPLAGDITAATRAAVSPIRSVLRTLRLLDAAGAFLGFLRLLIQRIPVLQVAVLARGVDRLAGVQQSFGVLGVDGLQRGRARVLQGARQLDERRSVVVDQLFHLRRLRGLVARRNDERGDAHQHKPVKSSHQIPSLGNCARPMLVEPSLNCF